jgi:hypothetical protein
MSGYNGQLGDNGNSAIAGGSANLGSFYTFCIEYSEHFNPGLNYYTEIATSSEFGGLSGGNPDPIDGITAALYREFRNGGNFGGVGSIDGSAAGQPLATSLQLALWYEEGELFGNPNNLMTVYSGGTQVGINARAMTAWGVSHNIGLGDVRVLRLWTSDTLHDPAHAAQDQLTLIPLPQTAYLGITSFAGLMGLGYVRRRSHRS